MRRREVITLLGGAAAAWPLAARAQQPAMPVIGFLSSSAPVDRARYLTAFRQGLRESTFVEGQNVAIEYRWAQDQADRLPDLAADLVRRQVTVIAAHDTPSSIVAKAATTTIPIVYTGGGDPVKLGLVASLNRPGGNITGTTMLLTELAAKGLEMMAEALPQTRRIGVLWNPTTPSHSRALPAVETAGEKLALELRMVPARGLEDFDSAFATMAQERVGAFLAVGSPLVVGQRVPLAALALKHRLPGMFPFKENVVAGGLMSYGADPNYLYRRAAAYIDKILKGAKPADLPVEQASKYELVINLKTAKALGLDLPASVLARADEVIE